jgi:hypothetical protein
LDPDFDITGILRSIGKENKLCFYEKKYI